ncbi:MAG: lipoate--protein ligase family protein [Chloroflexi bacterium]|nr:lipoate--protein ligase family protein [Chloroflexota bacterium]
MDTWRLLLTPPAHGAWNMAVDETLLESVGRGASLPTLRLYAWQRPCLSLGYAQPFSDIDRPRLLARGWDVLRRPTGGRAILHSDELTYSVIAPPDEPRLAGTLLESYNRLAQALLAALQSLGLPVEIQARAILPAAHLCLPVLADSPGRHWRRQNTNPVCFEVPSTYEITVGGKKLVGSAQARRKEGVLQHGSLPLGGDLTRILQVLAFPNEAARLRAAERLLAHATTVESALGRPVSWAEAAQAFISAFGDRLDLDLQPRHLTPAEEARVEELVKNKYAHPEWTQRVAGLKAEG